MPPGSVDRIRQLLPAATLVFVSSTFQTIRELAVAVCVERKELMKKLQTGQTYFVDDIFE